MQKEESLIEKKKTSVILWFKELEPYAHKYLNISNNQTYLARNSTTSQRQKAEIASLPVVLPV